MKKTHGWAYAALLGAALLTAGCGGQEQSQQSPQATEPTPTGNEQVVNVTGANWRWDLDKQEVKKGQPVMLVIKNTEGVHGLRVAGTDVKTATIKPGEEKRLIFTPEKAGDLYLECSIMCGTGHGQMKVPLKVVE